MAARTVKLGFVVFTNAEGRPVTGYLGDEVDVHKDDLARFDKVNVAPEIPDANATEAALAQAEVKAAAAEVEVEAQKVAEAKTALEAERTAFEAEKAAFEATKAEAEKAAAAKTPPAKAAATTKQA